MKHMPHDRHVARRSSSLFRRTPVTSTAPGRAIGWRRGALLAAAISISAGLLPAGIAGATSSSGTPSLKAVLAKANALSQQIDKLSEQYDGLKIQLTQAEAAVKVAREDAARDEEILGQDRVTIGAIAATGYMSGGVNPSIALLQSSTPQSMLDRASMLTQLEAQNGAKLKLVAAAEQAAQRAQAAAAQEQKRAKQLAAQMKAKVAQIQKKQAFFNGQAFKQAEAIFQKTGKYPSIHVSGDSLGVQAVQMAENALGDPYVWGAAGPSSFDCSGLVVWAYGQLGVHLMHFTGDLWNEGEHVARSELEPGDLVFFFADISHVGIYVGNGMMIDAPTFGQDVQIQPVFWSAYVGAVRIIA